MKVTLLDPALQAHEDAYFIKVELTGLKEMLGSDVSDAAKEKLEAAINKASKPHALTAEALCMLQALNSRSAEGIDEKLEKVYAGNPKEFAEKYIIGYNHKSVGQGASTTLFIEDVSILAAKAVQQTKYYKGIEASTRYIDLQSLGYHLPASLKDYEYIVEEWLSLFNQINDMMRVIYKAQPKPDDMSDKMWDNACNAAAFDVARGWIPCAQKTLLSYHGDICGIGEHTQYLRTHHLREVRDLGAAIHGRLTDTYPTSVPPLSEARREYLLNNNTSIPTVVGLPEAHASVVQAHTSNVRTLKRSYQTYPHISASTDTYIEAYVNIDYGSWRDLQRHRPIMGAAPIISPLSNFHEWYFKQLPDTAAGNAIIVRTMDLVREVRTLLNDNVAPVEALQYLCPMGILVRYNMAGSLADFVYMVELRSGAGVHPTAREAALAMGKDIEDSLGVELFLDKSKHKVYPDRGGDTITEK